MERPRIARIELRCSNVEASAEFYSRLVGLEIVELTDARSALAASAGGEPLLVLHRSRRPGQAPRRATGLFHTAFLYQTRSGLASALRRLGERLRHPLTGASDHGVSEALYLDDPDGLGIELYADRPRERWPEPPPGERVRMYTAPLDLADLAAAEAPDAPAEAGIGHVHLKVSDPDVAAGFFGERVGMDLMTRFGPDAVFLGFDGYHHHVGANSWFSRDAAPEPQDGPGLERIAIRAGRERAGERLQTPDGVEVELVGSR